MNATEFNRDEVLTNFLTDYLDNELDHIEIQSFEAYLAENPLEKAFARKAARGKRALEFMRKHLKSPKQLA